MTEVLPLVVVLGVAAYSRRVRTGTAVGVQGQGPVDGTFEFVIIFEDSAGFWNRFRAFFLLRYPRRHSTGSGRADPTRTLRRLSDLIANHLLGVSHGPWRRQDRSAFPALGVIAR